MSRKGQAEKREVLADPIYNSKLVTRLINRLMVDGKRGKASTILYKAFDAIKEQTGDDPVEVFEQALENIMPVLEVKARRVGGSNYQVPVEVSELRSFAWRIQHGRAFSERNYGCSEQHRCISS